MKYIKQEKKRFKNIDCLRFIFAVLVVMFHFSQNSDIHSVLPGLGKCQICVDYFFIIAGFFLFNTINTAQSTLKFVKKRFLRLAPTIWFFLGIMAIIGIFAKGILINLSNNILRILLLHNIGFGPLAGGVGSHVHWFVSALFWTSIFYFYIAKITTKKYLNIIIWLIIIFAYGLHFNYNNFNTGGNIKNIFYVFNIGILRALGGMGLGYFISELYKTGFLHKTKPYLKIVTSILEMYICGFLAYYMLFSSKLPAKSGFTFIVMFSILLYLFLVKHGVLSKLLDNKFSSTLGNYSYSIYIMQMMIPVVFRSFIHSSYLVEHNVVSFTLQVFCAILVGIITHYLFEKPIGKLISQKVK